MKKHPLFFSNDSVSGGGGGGGGGGCNYSLCRYRYIDVKSPS
jgi:hypothetical protein